MNGSCAGGTGAFIDQMATLLDVTPSEMDTLADESTKTYSIASRCGVFAKSDIQALLNQGALKQTLRPLSFLRSSIKPSQASHKDARSKERPLSRRPSDIPPCAAPGI